MKKTIIGVYRPNNPIEASGPERLEAALAEAENANIRLVFFDNESIVFSQNMINGIYFEEDERKNIRTNIPEVIINPLPTTKEKRTNIERTLRKMSTFTSYGVLGKYDTYKKLLESENLSQYAIESIEVNSYKEIYASLDKYEKVVFKPMDGRQGDRIYFIYRHRDKIIVKDHIERVQFTEETFKMFVDEKLREGRYLVQPYIDARTKDGEPYDFRIHLHRDSKGEWAVVKSYPRIGDKKGILSNISKGGRTQDIDEFLQDEFGERGSVIKEEIESLAIELSDYINSFSSHKINEIGVDIAIDSQGNYWTYELNGGPQSKYHEAERAKYVIEYAKYLYDEYVEKKIESELKYIGGEFLRIETKLFNKDFEDEIYVGMMVPNTGYNYFALACYHIALQNDVNFFYFSPNDVDYSKKRIHGYTFESQTLKRFTFPYPDVILDKLKARGNYVWRDIYDEFKDIPMNYTRSCGPASKSHMYNLLSQNRQIVEFLIPYIDIRKTKELRDFILNYQNLILKPNKSLGGKGIEEVSRYKDKYKIDSETLNLDEVQEYVLYKLESDYVLQKKIISVDYKNRPFDIRIRLDKGEQAKWVISVIYGRVGNLGRIQSTGTGYEQDIQTFLKVNFGDKSDKILRELEVLGYIIANYVDENIESRISEMGIDIGIDENYNLWIFEVNIGDPGLMLNEYKVAKNLIPYCIYLAKEDRKKNLAEANN